MNTPIVDFVKNYQMKHMARLHMPGHKGKSFLGCEEYDITEIKGADSLYEADGIIAESESNATNLFATGKTVFSTEGSSQCIRAMLYLAVMANPRKKRVILAARNVHKAFVYAAALLDLEVVWLYPEGNLRSLCSCHITSDYLKQAIENLEEPPVAVYVTSPDYLGGQLNIKDLADICHRYNTILTVDNAHGAYLHFLKESTHPMDLGADICCDSAHKTLPVLTGGAYLHISKKMAEIANLNVKKAMSLFGSTSPSYLILQSLDLCNHYLSDSYREKLELCISKIKALKEVLKTAGWEIESTEELKLTIRVPAEFTGYHLAQLLREHKIECEFADPDYIVCMFTPEINDEVYEQIIFVLNKYKPCYKNKTKLEAVKTQQLLSIREAVFSVQEEIPVKDSLGRICASPTVSCPPAIPIVVSGELIDENAIHLLKYYEIETIDVVKGKDK